MEEGWGIFHKVFATACLKQFNGDLDRPNISVFIKLAAKWRKTSVPAYHVDTRSVAILIFRF